MNSITKGKRFEKEAVKILTESTNHQWFRVPNSGSMQTAQGIDDHRFKGDVFCDHQDYKEMMVECKYVNHNLITSVFNPGSPLHKWFEKCDKQSMPWILLLKIRHQGVYAISPYKTIMDMMFPDLEIHHEILIDRKYLWRKVR